MLDSVPPTTDSFGVCAGQQQISGLERPAVRTFASARPVTPTAS